MLQRRLYTNGSHPKRQNRCSCNTCDSVCNIACWQGLLAIVKYLLTISQKALAEFRRQLWCRNAFCLQHCKLRFSADTIMETVRGSLPPRDAATAQRRVWALALCCHGNISRVTARN